MTRYKDIISSVVLLLVAGGLWLNLDLDEVPEHAARYPKLLLMILGVMVLGILIPALVKLVRKPDAQTTVVPDREALTDSGKCGFPTLLILGASLAYVLVMPYLGFTISSAILLVGLMLALGVRNILALILVPVIEISILLFVFEHLLAVFLPDTESLRMMLGF